MRPLAELKISDRIKIAKELYNAYLESKERFNAFITLRDWDTIEDEIENCSEGLLSGILIPVKDNISTKGILTTCASRILSNYIPPYDASVIRFIKDEGGIIAGKTNMDEFAMGNTNETSYYGPVLNPWDTSRVPGGSSGGSAVAVAWKGYLALGSDTGGSIRLPACYNGIYGLKPTYGMVSRYGLIAYANSLEQIGPMARFIKDLALLYYVISRYDEKDITMVRNHERERVRKSLIEFINGNIDMFQAIVDRAFMIYPKDLIEYADDDVKEVFYKTLDFYNRFGFKIEDFKGEFLKAGLPAYYIIAMVEASSNLARYIGVNFGLRIDRATFWDMVARTRSNGFGVEVKRRIIMGAYASSKGYEERYYLKALKVRRWIRDKLLEIIRGRDKYTFIALPTSLTKPPKFGESLGPRGYIQDIYTVIANLAGLPAISIPSNYVNDLPLGIQLIGDYFTDDILIYIASLVEGKIYNPLKLPKGGYT